MERFEHEGFIFAAILPTTQVLTVDGGHDWPTWRGLRTSFLYTPAFRRNLSRQQDQRP